jgi:hypothetical protein
MLMTLRDEIARDASVMTVHGKTKLLAALSRLRRFSPQLLQLKLI